MEQKLKSASRGKKARRVSAAICAALVLSLGAATAWAATNSSWTLKVAPENLAGGVDEMTISFTETGAALPEGVAPEEAQYVIRNENGVIVFSTDGGETWAEEVPESLLNYRGGINSYSAADGDVSRDDFFGNKLYDENSFAANGIDRVDCSFSADGGKTWSVIIPDFATLETHEDGSVSFSVTD